MKCEYYNILMCVATKLGWSCTSLTEAVAAWLFDMVPYQMIEMDYYELQMNMWDGKRKDKVKKGHVEGDVKEILGVREAR